MLVQINEFMYIKHIKHFVKETFVNTNIAYIYAPPPSLRVFYKQISVLHQKRK